MRMIEMNLFLYDCCQYPVIARQPKVYDHCLKKCSEFDFCCFQECSARQSGTFDDNNQTLVAEKLKSIFLMQQDNGKFKNLTEEWTKVMSNSVENCNGNTLNL